MNWQKCEGEIMFSELELDALKEISNIGTGQAATSLSIIIAEKVCINVPQIKVVPFEEVSNSVGGPEKLVVGIFARVSGDIEGTILIILSDDDAYYLVGILLKQTVDRSNGFSIMGESALIELGNIISSSYVAALSDFTGLDIKLSVPGFAFDMAGAILSFPLSLYGFMGDSALLIETQFTGGLDGGRLHFFLIPDDKSFKLLLKSIGVGSIERSSAGGNG